MQYVVEDKIQWWRKNLSFLHVKTSRTLILTKCMAVLPVVFTLPGSLPWVCLFCSCQRSVFSLLTQLHQRFCKKFHLLKNNTQFHADSWISEDPFWYSLKLFQFLSCSTVFWAPQQRPKPENSSQKLPSFDLIWWYKKKNQRKSQLAILVTHPSVWILQFCNWLTTLASSTVNVPPAKKTHSSSKSRITKKKLFQEKKNKKNVREAGRHERKGKFSPYVSSFCSSLFHSLPLCAIPYSSHCMSIWCAHVHASGALFASGIGVQQSASVWRCDLLSIVSLCLSLFSLVQKQNY